MSQTIIAGFAVVASSLGKFPPLPRKGGRHEREFNRGMDLHSGTRLVSWLVPAGRWSVTAVAGTIELMHGRNCASMPQVLAPLPQCPFFAPFFALAIKPSHPHTPTRRPLTPFVPALLQGTSRHLSIIPPRAGNSLVQCSVQVHRPSPVMLPAPRLDVDPGPRS